MEMEKLLQNIIGQYSVLMECYERVYERFTAADCMSIDEYIKTIDDISSYITQISDTQIKIAECRNTLKKDVHNEILIDSIIDAYSNGKFLAMIDRIGFIVTSLQVFEKNAKSTLHNEMNKIQYGLEEVGIDEEYFKLFSELSKSSETDMKN